MISRTIWSPNHCASEFEVNENFELVRVIKKCQLYANMTDVEAFADALLQSRSAVVEEQVALEGEGEEDY